MGTNDSTIKNIKAGNGIKPTSSNGKPKTEGITTITSESDKGISYLKHSLDDSKKEKR